MLSSLFGRKKKKQAQTVDSQPKTIPPDADAKQKEAQQKLVFHTQLAHGSPTGRIEGFGNVRELYQKIAAALGVPKEEILFCTLNTHKCDMSRLLGGQIGLEDFIFAHVKGQKKTVQLTKSCPSLGLTITDNGAGYAFVKRMQEGSIVENCKNVCVGDHIQAIDDANLVGCRHFEVARKLKEIPLGTTFTVSLVEPQKAFDMISQRKSAQTAPSNQNIGSGKATLRLRSRGPATVEAIPTEQEDKAINRIDDCLESFMGIRDSELATTIFEAGKDCSNPNEFNEKLVSQLGDFGFPEVFIFDVWGIISDARKVRIQ